MLAYQTSVFGQGVPTVLDAGVERTFLDEFSWVDHAHTWLAGADELLADLARSDREPEGCNDDMTDLLDSFMQSEANQEDDAFDLAQALAAELLKAPCSRPAALALDLPMPMLQWEPSPLL